MKQKKMKKYQRDLKDFIDQNIYKWQEEIILPESKESSVEREREIEI